MATIKSIGHSVFSCSTAEKQLRKFIHSSEYSKILIFTDDIVAKKVLPAFIKITKPDYKIPVFEMKNGEKNKTLKTCESVWNFLTQQQADRHTLLINIGGGVVSDLGGFCASVYKRGIDFINIPTTVLSMADAAVGGKTGIDFDSFKNHIGTFQQPKGVFVFPEFLKSLDARHKTNGLAEIVKAAIIFDSKFFQQIVSIEKTETLWEEKMLMQSIAIKNKVVSADPKEKNLRKILNFGHSIGHGIESVFLNKKSNYLLHGEAIAAGMIMEAHISFQKKLINLEDLISISLLISRWFPLLNIGKADWLKILALIVHDKKNKNKKLLFALPNRIGKCLPTVEVNIAEINQAFHFYNAL